MKKVLTIVVDDGLAKEIFDEYYEFADYLSIETENEYNLRNQGWKIYDDFDDDELDSLDDTVGTCDHCGETDCDCDTQI